MTCNLRNKPYFLLNVLMLFVVGCNQIGGQLAYELPNGYKIFMNRHGLYSLRDKNDKTILPYHHRAMQADRGVISLQKEGKMGCTTMKGEWLIPCEYDALYFNFCDYPQKEQTRDQPLACNGRIKDSIIICRKQQQYHIRDKHGNLFTDTLYDEVSFLSGAGFLKLEKAKG